LKGAIETVQKRTPDMQRTPVNPWPWSLALGYNQAEIITAPTRQLNIAGQTAVDPTGAPQHTGDMRAQIALTLDNLESVLQAAGMGLAHLTRLAIYSTDVDATLQNFDVLGARMGPVGAAPPMTLLGVTRLAIPTLLIEIEATAAS
jgi:enamine deaminase RidA (YjgF/YER057c/UK114 family)